MMLLSRIAIALALALWLVSATAPRVLSGEQPAAKADGHNAATTRPPQDSPDSQRAAPGQAAPGQVAPPAAPLITALQDGEGGRPRQAARKSRRGKPQRASWYSDFALGLKAARARHKQLFVMLETKWCPHCTELERSVLPDASVQEFLFSNFVCIKLDADLDEVQDFQNQYHVYSVPAFMIFNGDGALVSAIGKSPKTANDFIYYITRMMSGDSI